MSVGLQQTGLRPVLVHRKCAVGILVFETPSDPQRASAPCNLAKSLPVPHVDLGAGLLQHAHNRPTIITLVGTVAVGMVPASPVVLPP